MSLKEIISIWNEAVILFDSGKYRDSIEKFRVIPDQSAKIVFNIGSLCLIADNCDQALKCFSEALSKDPFLAVAYFQRGCSHLKLKRYRDAEQDFQSTLDKLRGSELIDYRQLGLPTILYSCQVLYNLAVAVHHQGKTDEASKLIQNASRLVQDSSQEPVIAAALSSLPNLHHNLLEIPPQDSIFRPSKSAVANLQKKDFLGKAKVISSVAENDKFVGFEGSRKCHSSPTSPTLSRRHNQLYVDDMMVKKGTLTPPPPTRAPPILTISVADNYKLNVNTDIQPNKESFLLNGHSGLKSSEEMRSRPKERSRPPPPVYAPPSYPTTQLHSTSALLNSHSGSRSNEELRSRSNERSRPPPPAYAPPSNPTSQLHSASALLNIHSGSRSSEELRSRSSERSKPPPPRPPPPSYAPSVLSKSGNHSDTKVKPQRPPPPVTQTRL